VLRADGETETTQENAHDWFELDEGDPGFQLLFSLCSDIYFFSFSSVLPVLLHFLFICFLRFYPLKLCFASLILMTSPPS
jgi:hypothetical protein